MPPRYTPTSVPDDTAAAILQGSCHAPEFGLHGYLRKRFPRLPDIEDLVQEAYLRLWRTKSARQVRSERGLLFSIARNAAFDRFRSRAKYPMVSLPEDPNSSVYLDDANVAEIASNQEEIGLLRDAIASLPGRCREILVLRRIQNLSHRQIAERLDITEHTVEKQVGIGLRKCLEYLRRHGVDPRRS